MRIFVGNLSYQTENRDLEDAFRPYGEVTSATVVMDRASGRSKGFAFVEMANQGEAQAAISALSGKELDGRALTVNEAKPREDRSFSGGGGDRNRGGGGGNYRSDRW